MHQQLILPESCPQADGAYKEIPLTRGLVAIVDERDYEYLMQWKWQAQRKGDKAYAVHVCAKQILGRIKSLQIHMSWAILNMHGIEDFKKAYHVNGNGLDNRLGNLQPVIYRSIGHCHVNNNHLWDLQPRICKLPAVEEIRHKNNLGVHNRGLSIANKSGYRGVSFNSKTKKWRADIRGEDKRKYLGYFNTPQEAAKAYNKTALELYGEYAWLNPIEDEHS